MARIVFRRANATMTVTGNPVLRRGEPGWDLDTRAVKLGDGTTPWDELPDLTQASVSSGVAPPNSGTPGPFYIQTGGS